MDRLDRLMAMEIPRRRLVLLNLLYFFKLNWRYWVLATFLIV